MSTLRPGCFIAGAWREGAGEPFTRDDPARGGPAWAGRAASQEDIEDACNAAAGALDAWAALTDDQRGQYLERFAAVVAARREAFLQAICLETGRPRWEVRTECEALATKVGHTRKALAARRSAVETTQDGVTAATRYRPLGVVAVLGPFNLPAHLPNGHIVPALLAGNTVVFKPSELAPGVGELYARSWEEAGLPAGVFNMIQGGRAQGRAMATDARVAGVLFTGSRAAGVALSKALADRPETLLALEMGGNNPLLATGISNLLAAAVTVIQSAFITAGQRCTCARRLILLKDAEGDRILERVVGMTRSLRVGPPDLSPEPFMGPVISDAAAGRLLAAQDDLLKRGGVGILPLRQEGMRPAMLSPGIIDVTGVAEPGDEEHFGPLLQVLRVADFGAAVAAANRTRYGLAAALLSDDAGLYAHFRRAVRAGIINWNRPTTGASSALPFGGVGDSGNHRPAGAFSVDYASDPVASLESAALALPATLPPGIQP